MSDRKKPSEIRFSQDTIKSHWKKFSGTIGETLDQLLTGEVKLDKIPNIKVKERNGNIYSADNRRLWVFQKLEKLGKCDTIAVKFGYIEPRKFTTKNLGTSVRIRGSGDPGGRIWKSLEKDTVCLTFTAASALDASPSSRADEWTDTTLTSAFKNTIQIDEMEKTICLNEIGYFQTDPITDEEYLGELLDDYLQLDFSKYFLKLQVFKRFGKYYTKECKILWALKNLEKFRKSPEIEFTMTDPPFQEMNESTFLHSHRDSFRLRPNALIGGSVWKNIDFLKELPTIEIVNLPVSDIFFYQENYT